MIKYEKPKIMRRVAYANTEAARSCLGCGAVLCTKLPDWIGRLECPHCGTTIQVKRTNHGSVVLTDDKYAEYFLHEDSTAQIWMREDNNDKD